MSLNHNKQRVLKYQINGLMLKYRIIMLIPMHTILNIVFFTRKSCRACILYRIHVRQCAWLLC